MISGKKRPSIVFNPEIFFYLVELRKEGEPARRKVRSSTLGIGDGSSWPMLHTQGMAIIDLYYADQLTLEEALEQVNSLWIENARQNILDNPQWDAAGWGCEKLVYADLIRRLAPA